MRVAMPFFLLAALTISVLVAGSSVGIIPDELLEAEASQSRSQRPSVSMSLDELDWYENYRDSWVLDFNYDDSWVANVPEFIGGYRVLYITTPKSLACRNSPTIYFQAAQESPEEYLAAPLDLPSLRAALHSIPGVPSKLTLSFSGGTPVDVEEWAEQDRIWNEISLKEGCLGPSGPISAE